MLRTLGSGGGLDLIGVILNKRWNIGIGRFNFCFNAVMFLASMATISLDMVIVSFIQVFVASATIEYALRMGSQRKMVYVVTDRGEALCEAIIAEGYGGADRAQGQGRVQRRRPRDHPYRNQQYHVAALGEPCFRH